MPNHARLHHNAPCRAEQSGAPETESAAAKGRAPVDRRAPTNRRETRGVPGFFRGAQHLVDEALGLRRAGVADAPGPNTQIVVARGHSRTSKRVKARTVPKASLISLFKIQGAARAPTDRHARTQAMPMACGSTGEPLLSRLPNRAGVSVRFLHIFLLVRCRSISGSLLLWRFSGGTETLPEQSAT
ncbi:hypothetical protein ABID59_002174 [Bradyrhizobium sp. S3.3.6]